MADGGLSEHGEKEIGGLAQSRTSVPVPCSHFMEHARPHRHVGGV